MKKKNKILSLIKVISSILIVLFITIAVFLYFNLQVTDTFKNSDHVEFIIEEGSYGKEVLNKLKNENIIKNSELTYYYAKLFADTDFKSGRFVIPTTLNLKGLLNYLCCEENAKPNTVTLTIVEGSFATEIASILSNNLNIDYNELIDSWSNEAFVRQLMIDYPFLTEDIFDPNIKIYLEGYLFPSTYEFNFNSSIETVTRTFLNGSRNIYEKYLNNFENSPVFYHYDDDEYREASIHEIFTLASILQWESGSLDEMDKISSVFYNRLNKPEILGSTVTSCYSAGLTKEECGIVGDNLEYTWREDGYTYNTYTKQGLPIGPVLSPGEDSIVAALNPADTDYFYFVGDICEGTGTIFASTYSEHEYNIEKYVNCSFD